MAIVWPRGADNKQNQEQEQARDQDRRKQTEQEQERYKFEGPKIETISDLRVLSSRRYSAKLK